MPLASRSLPEVFLLKLSELIEVEVESPASETVLTVTESREVPVRLNVVVHSTAAWEAAAPRARDAMIINVFFITGEG